MKYKKPIDYVFKQYPELSEIGTKEQYEAYLKTVFPDRKVQNIVYHQTGKKFDHFDIDKSKTGGIYFSPFNNNTFIKHTKAAIIDIEKPLIISKKQNKKLEKYLPNIKRLKKKINLQDYDGVIGFSNVFYDKGQLDSKIIDLDSSLKNNIEFAVFNSKKIYLLGSKEDIQGFKDYVKGKSKKVPKGNSLENKLISGIFIMLFIAGLFFASPNLTGNVISNSNVLILNISGIALILFGAIGFFIHKLKYKYKK